MNIDIFVFYLAKWFIIVGNIGFMIGIFQIIRIGIIEPFIDEDLVDVPLYPHTNFIFLFIS